MTKKRLNQEYGFDKKWSPAIAAHGFTSIPNLLLRQYESLGITAPELRMIIVIEMHRWDDREPHPSVATLAKLIRTSPRRAREIITSLHTKGLILRTVRDYKTSTYNYDRLIHKLDQLATSSLPPGRKAPPSWDETRLERGMKTSSEEDAANKTPMIKPTVNTGIEKVGETLNRRYLQ
jgi:hypothetical protein